jgi:hypothetical protein
VKQPPNKRTRLHPRDKKGQSLVLFALLFPLMLLFAAFAIDAAHAFVDYRHLQNTADASSLAAAQNVNGGGCPGCGSTASQYVSLNDGPSGMQECASGGVPITTYIATDPTDTPNCYQFPYVDKNGDQQPGEVLVWLHSCTATWIGGFVGVHKICMSVRSVARATPVTSTVISPPVTSVTPGFTTVIDGTTQVTPPSTSVSGGTTSVTPGNTSVTPGTTIVTPGTTSVVPATTGPSSTLYTTTVATTGFTGGTPRAIFANDTTCGPTKGIVYNSNPNSSIDAVESNGSINLPSSNKGVLSAGYLPGGSSAPSGCLSDQSQPGPPTNGLLNTYSLPAQSWPVTYDRPTVCTGHDSNKAVVLKNPADGIYCSTVSIEVTAFSGKNPTLTLVAPQITIDNTVNNFTLHGYYKNAAGYALSVWQTTNGQDSTTGPTFVFNNNNAGIADVLWVQNGDLDYVGNSGVTGFYEAQNVTIGGLNGNSYVMHGSGPPIGGVPSATTIINPVTTVPGTVGGGTTVVQPPVTNVTPGTTTVTPGSTTVTPGTTIVQPGTTIVQPPVTNVTPGSTNVTPGSTQVNTTGTDYGLGE